MLTVNRFVRPIEKNLNIYFHDVGYADAITIIFPDQSVMLIDAGGRDYASTFSRAYSQWGIHTIQTAFISHPHKNHFEGFLSLLDHVRVQRVFINGDHQAEEGYGALITKFKYKNVPIKQVLRGNEVSGLPDGIHAEILSPKDLSGSANGNSLVLWLVYKNTSFLFTGDIESREQEAIVREFPFVQGADIVQVPHHGRLTTLKFLTYFKNAVFVVSTGENQWESPDQFNFESIRNPLWRTDKHGTIHITSDGRRVHLSSK